MEAAQFSNANADQIAGELAAELCQQQASLSDVRVAVQELYQGDRQGADAYLLYLERHGFPAPPASSPSSPVANQALSQQQAAIASYEPNAYGQIATEQQKTISLYDGNLISELAANSAYSALILGERRSGTSAILRAIAYDRIGRSGQTILDILDLHNGEWGGLEDVRLEDGSQIVSYQTLTISADIELIAQKLSAIASEVKRRQQQQRGVSLSLTAAQPPPAYLFLIDGLSEIHGVLPGWSADRRSKEANFAQAASSLRVILSHGPAVGLSCVVTARDHTSCLCDASALAETRLLCLGRVSPGRNGGYRAIDRAIEDKTLLPSPHERHRWREVMSAVKQLAHPVVFTPNGIPRLGSLGDFSGYLRADLLTHYQQALEVQR